ncbi:DUF6233 domain-containing protein [Streptomyces sp. NPDC014793]|uniref:DUF6233 domain-containing protein n=1 Tax=Streptomyces sp. NPDC014793 TaxID=3364914 RepID=UPI00370342EE
MTDLPPDLPRLRTLETWLAVSLARVRQQIADLERRERERKHGEENRPEPPDWLLELGLNRDHAVYVHAGGCWNAGKRSRGVDQAAALRALADGVPACLHCRPDSELGWLEG